MEFHKLDNIGTFYASTSMKEHQDVFRFSVTLTEDVDKSTLVKALKTTRSAFPSFNSSLKSGLFWYYLEEEDKLPEVKEEDLPICHRMDTYTDEILYRVSYYKNRLNLEVSHIVSDGRGTLEFFTSLVENYLAFKYKIKGIDNQFKASITEREEDSFDKYYEKSAKPIKNKGKIYNLTGKEIRNHKVRFIEMHMNTGSVIALSKKNDCTMTSYLTAVLIRSILRTMKYKDKGTIVRIAVPVDLRSYYYSKTVKNFFGIVYVSYTYKGEVDSTETIIKSVSEQLTESLKKENVNKRSNQMFSIVTNVVVRSIPLVVKNIGLYFIDKITSKACTTNISNLGRITFNEKVEKYIKGIALLTNSDGLNFVVSSYKDDLCISASTVFNKNNVLNYFLQELKSNGIEISIATNGV